MATRKKLWDKKHEDIIEAATDIFLKYGYAVASMDLIAEKAGVSKITIYKHFKDKTQLFNKMMTAHCQSLYNEVPLIEFTTKISPENVIKEFSMRLVDALLKPRSLALMRVVIFESSQFPAVANSVWENGRMPLLDIFQDYLTKEVTAKRLHIEDKDLAARQFFGMIKENIIWPILIGMEKNPPNHKSLQNIIHHSVHMFLNYYRVGKKRGK